MSGRTVARDRLPAGSGDRGDSTVVRGGQSEIVGQETEQASVLLVCTANRCRSPMAEGILRDYITRAGTGHDWRIASAGTWAIANLPAMPLAIAVLEENRIDLRAHRSSRVNGELLQRYRLVLVMTEGHRESICLEFPDVSDRVFLISEMAGYTYGIDDPVAGTIDDYRSTADLLRRLIEQGYDRMYELALPVDSLDRHNETT